MDLTLTMDVPEESLIAALEQLDYEQIVSLIVKLDADIADSWFSESLLLALLKACKEDVEGFSTLGAIDWEKV